ncbi:hypothetical protein [Xanthomonas sp. NCPPB 2632]|uniref:hypothetical protein n=1 Tax=Xanthomonas sp. NCPPB 2632 TaxID=3240912 RepID=UPI0035116994
MTSNDQTVEIDSVSLGRSGRFTGEGYIALEVQRFAGNRPTVDRVVGVSPQGSPRLQRVSPDSTSRSGGGNGYDKFHGLPDGLYKLSDVLSTGSRTYITYVWLDDASVDEYHPTDIGEVLTELFPGDVAAAKAHTDAHTQRLVEAQKILSEIVEERQAMAGPVVDGDMTANPEFPALPTAEEVATHVQREAFERIEYIMHAAAPRCFIVNVPVFAKAATPVQAFAQARATLQTRLAETEAAKSLAGAQGWPALTGTPKQIQWAEAIRAKFAARKPQDRALKTATTAKYWIDNHR